VGGLGFLAVVGDVVLGFFTWTLSCFASAGRGNKGALEAGPFPQCLLAPRSPSSTKGEVFWGEEAWLAELHGRRISPVFQMFNLVPNLTALENVELSLIFLGLPPRGRRRKPWFDWA